MNKSWWKAMMYSSPSWYYIARSSKSKDAEEAADEYEDAMGTFGIVILVLLALGLAIFGLVKLIQAF